MTATETAINLQRYCGDKDAGYYWENPFVVGDYRYATNGHVVVRIPSGGEAPTTLTSKIIKGAPALSWPQLVAESRLIPWPAIDWVFEYRLEEVAWFPERELTTLGDAEIDTKYHYLVSLLPNVRYLLGGEAEPIYFRFDGGEGLVMPMRKGIQ